MPEQAIDSPASAESRSARRAASAGGRRKWPRHWPETPFPGQGGNFVASGHRTTYGTPFRKLNSAKEGDEIFLVLPHGVARHVVSRIVIVYPKDVESVAQAGKEQVSLADCHPIYSAKQRIVVQGGSGRLLSC